MSKSITFDNAGDFEATTAAVKWLTERGFSIGSMQAGSPRAIWHGDCRISKWRGLSPKDKQEMHASMWGNDRDGPITIMLHTAATDEARAAFQIGAADS